MHVGGVIPPEYIPSQVTIPTLDEIHALKDVASDALRLLTRLDSFYNRPHPGGQLTG
ncbi:hypothetical protein [Streptomyces platensis]|uniref:hypothetical protein n=1 Tax=Streptomyces platensis TaxID=58346 RepID=UPI001F1D1CB3|nr:hypothetical protein [Streptomyces platensis]MCF3145451.1 hypothetical protein [Streptomyces platensis]